MDLSNFERLSKLGAFESKTESSTVRPPDFSDAGNAEVFTQAHKGNLIFKTHSVFSSLLQYHFLLHRGNAAAFC